MASTIALTALTTSAAFISNYFKLAPTNFSERDRLAIRVISAIAYIKQAGGTDYTANHNKLVSDAKNFTIGISNIDVGVAMAASDWAAAESSLTTIYSGAANANDPVFLLGKGSDFRNLSEDELNRIIAFFRVSAGI